MQTTVVCITYHEKRNNVRLFDVHQFELPEKEVIDWEKTKGEIGSMLSSYLVSRERMGLTRMPVFSVGYGIIGVQ